MHDLLSLSKIKIKLHGNVFSDSFSHAPFNVNVRGDNFVSVKGNSRGRFSCCSAPGCPKTNRKLYKQKWRLSLDDWSKGRNNLVHNLIALLKHHTSLAAHIDESIYQIYYIYKKIQFRFCLSLF